MSALYPDLDFTNYPGELDNIQLKSNIAKKETHLRRRCVSVSD